MVSLGEVADICRIGAYIAAAISALLASFTYRGEARRRRAEWAFQLFERFFAGQAYRSVRDRLDAPENDDQVAQLVNQESPDFTDYLNFFEFAAYLMKSKQITKADFDALFAYYIECLWRHEDVRRYIKSEDKGFENLRKLLNRHDRQRA
ncbi:MAG TPA: hypothetical protein VNE83_08855 [Terriglobales bacterium]|nr:hypothetical protein [Terriglobales bacterium]